MCQCPKAFRMLSTLAAECIHKSSSSSVPSRPAAVFKGSFVRIHKTLSYPPPIYNIYIYPVMAKYMCIPYALMSRKAGDDGWVLLLFYNYIYTYCNRNALKFVVYIFSYIFWVSFVFLYFICCMSTYIIFIIYV